MLSATARGLAIEAVGGMYVPGYTRPLGEGIDIRGGAAASGCLDRPVFGHPVGERGAFLMFS